jgi:hypothetical protein
MRKWIGLVVLVAWSCGAPEHEEYVIVDGFLARSTALDCSEVLASGELAVTELRTASDSTVLVLDGPGRRVLELDRSLRVVWEMEAPAQGPGFLDTPASAALLGDTAVVVVERRGLQLIVYGRDGSLIRSTPLPFLPNHVAVRSTGEVLVTAMPMGGTPPNLLFRYDGAEFHELPVPARPYVDMMIGAFGNSALVDVLPGDDAVLVHQFLSPRAFRITGDNVVKPLRMPTPDATREQVSFIPVAPITDDQLGRALVPAMAMSVDPIRSEIYLLTRSGRMVDGRPERAILHLDPELALLGSYTTTVRAGDLVFLPRHGVVLLLDDRDRIHACHLPLTGSGHARAD